MKWAIAVTWCLIGSFGSWSVIEIKHWTFVVTCCSGSFAPSVLLIGLSFLDCSQKALAVTLLTVAVSTSGCVFSGYLVNHMDIAPQYAGTLMGLSNAIGASSGFVAPYVTSVLTADVSSVTLWLTLNKLIGSNFAGVVVRTLDLGSRGCGFDFRSGHFWVVTTWLGR